MFNMRYRILITINQIIIRNILLSTGYNIINTHNLRPLGIISCVSTTND